MYPTGLRLRCLRERLGLTYRDVETASFQIALNRGRPDFILHISRLADMENNNACRHSTSSSPSPPSIILIHSNSPPGTKLPSSKLLTMVPLFLLPAPISLNPLSLSPFLFMPRVHSTRKSPLCFRGCPQRPGAFPAFLPTPRDDSATDTSD